LRKKYIYFSVIAFAFALLAKQTMWFAAPLYVAYLYIHFKNQFRKFIYAVLLMLGIGIIFVLPFIVWDAKAFIDSVVLYLSAGGKTGYPVSGYGLSMILFNQGVIKDLHQFYPFLLWQFAFGIPVILVTTLTTVMLQ
jgi:hypothetical protein